MGRAASSCCEVSLKDIDNTAGQGYRLQLTPGNVTVASKTCLINIEVKRQEWRQRSYTSCS